MSYCLQTSIVPVFFFSRLGALVAHDGLPRDARRLRVAGQRRVGEKIGRLHRVARQRVVDGGSLRIRHGLFPALVQRVPGPAVGEGTRREVGAVAADSSARLRDPLADGVGVGVGEADMAHVALGKAARGGDRARAADISRREVLVAPRTRALRSPRLVVVVPGNVGDRRVVGERVVDRRAQREFVVRRDRAHAQPVHDAHCRRRSGPAVVFEHERRRRQAVLVHRPRVVDHEDDVRVHRIDREQGLLGHIPDVGGGKGSGLQHQRLGQQKHQGARKAAPGTDGRRAVLGILVRSHGLAPMRGCSGPQKTDPAAAKKGIN